MKRTMDDTPAGVPIVSRSLHSVKPHGSLQTARLVERANKMISDADAPNNGHEESVANGG